MKKTLIYLAVTLMVIAASLATVAATSSEGKEVTVKGEVVDQPCFEGKNGARGEAHKACALSCAKRGNQLAVVEDKTNAIYSITGDYAANKNEKLIEFVTQMVEVKGTVTEKDGKKWLTVSSIKKLE
jgi:type 1 fimbria pilin